MENQELYNYLLEMTRIAIWPLVAVIAVVLGVFHAGKFHLKTPAGFSFYFTRKEAKDLLQNFVESFLEVHNELLKEKHKHIYGALIKSDFPLKVKDVLPEFDRDNADQIGSMRALRGIGLIRPRGGGSWDKNKYIELTMFGKQFAKHSKRILDKSESD